ncbi:MAG: hypothetical protein EXS12_03585 [Phycisphaerales bacterium]|nr:hypothetical protein [Phycisphaerales bacterium]
MTLYETSLNNYCTGVLNPETITWSISGAAIIGATAASLAWLLRASGWKNSWIAAGICAGVFFGPLCCAKIFPDFYNTFVNGCGDRQKELFRSQRAREALNVAAATTQTIPADSVLVELDAWERSAQIQLQEARSEFDYGALWITAMLAAAVTLARSPMSGRTHWWRGGGLAIGVWTVLIPIAAVLLIAKLETQEALTTWSLVAAAAVAFGAALPRGAEHWMTMGLLESNSSALDAARGTAGFISLAVAVVAAWGMSFDSAAAWLLPWGTMLAAWGLRDYPNKILTLCVGPATAACVAIALSRIDIPKEFEFTPTVGLYFAGEDLRWIAAAIGFTLTLSIPWLRSLRVSLAISSAPLPQAALASTALLIGVLPIWMGLSLLVAAAASEVLSPLRKITAKHLDQLIHSKPE